MATIKYGNTLTLADLKAANRAAGWHYFDKSTTRFFDSKVLPTVHTGKDGWYFVTSEQFHGSNGYSDARKYSVRVMREDGSIDTCGAFNEIVNVRDARKLAKLLASGTPLLAAQAEVFQCFA